jgi:hypothetical protein
MLSLGGALAVSMTAGSMPSWAASVASTSGSVSILSPSTAGAQQDMVTGMVVLPLVMQIGSTAGAISLPPQSLAPSTRIAIATEAVQRDVGRVVSSAGLQRASFTIIGDRDQVVSIAVPPSISLSRLSGGGEVGFSPVTSLTGNGGSANTLHASADGMGALAFDVGGRLQPSPSASAGDYAGVLKVTVQYN